MWTAFLFTLFFRYTFRFGFCPLGACFDYHKSPSFSLVAITIAMLALICCVLNYAIPTIYYLLLFVWWLLLFFFCSDSSFSRIRFIKWSPLFPTYTLKLKWLKIQRVTHARTSMRQRDNIAAHTYLLSSKSVYIHKLVVVLFCECVMRSIGCNLHTSCRRMCSPLAYQFNSYTLLIGLIFISIFIWTLHGTFCQLYMYKCIFCYSFFVRGSEHISLCLSLSPSLSFCFVSHMYFVHTEKKLLHSLRYVSNVRAL